MNLQGEEKMIRRILVAIDTSPSSMAALQAAADLAQQFGAELVGIFVEDIDLLRMAGLPFARRIGFYSATQFPIDQAQIEQEMRAMANKARQALLAMAQRAQLRSSFRVARGAIAEELVQASSEADLVILGKSGWSQRRRLGSTTRVVITQSPRHTLVIQRTFSARSLLGVVYDGSEDSRKALEAAYALLSGRGGSLGVIILAEDLEKARLLQQEVSQWLQSRGLAARFRWLVDFNPARLAALVNSERYGALVLPADIQALSGPALEAFLDDSEISVYVVH